LVPPKLKEFDEALHEIWTEKDVKMKIERGGIDLRARAKSNHVWNSSCQKKT
jgi:hypothetical protein